MVLKSWLIFSQVEFSTFEHCDSGCLFIAENDEASNFPQKMMCSYKFMAIIVTAEIMDMIPKPKMCGCDSRYEKELGV